MTAVGQRDEFLEGRYYEHPVTGARLESVTTVIGATCSKPWLTDWSANIAAQWIVDHLELVVQTVNTPGAGKTAARDLIKGAAKRKREAARDLGSHVHHIIEALMLKAPLPVFDDLTDDERAEIDNVAIGFLNFMQDFDVPDDDVEMAEATVADPVLGVAGTLDLIIKLRALGRLLIDAKSGEHLDATMAAQLATYRNMTEVWMPTGIIRPMPKVDGCAILHLRPEFERGYKLVRVHDETLGAASEWFHRMLAQHQRGQDFKKLPGRVLYPPLADGSQPPPMLEDVEGFTKVANVLREHGFRRLDELCDKRAEDVLKLKGIGEKSIKALAALLDEHNLAFQPSALTAALRAQLIERGRDAALGQEVA